MTKRNVGGRGQKAEYGTSVVRVPNPIKPHILEIIALFHDEREGRTQSNPSKKYWQISASELAEWIQSIDMDDECCSPIGACDLPRTEYPAMEQNWEEYERPKVATYIRLSDRINECLWQFDNTLICPPVEEDQGQAKGEGSNNFIRVGEITRKLIEYGLVHDDITANPSPIYEVFLFQKSMEWLQAPGDECYFELLRYALQKSRFDIVKALGIGNHQQRDRAKYWKEYYTSQIGKKYTNYFDWVANPESREIDPLLNALLSLPRPSFKVRYFLSQLPDTNTFLSYIDTMAQGHNKQAFTEWFDASAEVLGENVMFEIFSKIYKTGKSSIEKIFSTRDWWDVLGVAEKCTIAEARKAWKDLAKIYHPDVNPQGDRKIKEINNAWDKAEKSFTKSYDFIPQSPNTWDAYCSDQGEDWTKQYETYRQDFERKQAENKAAYERQREEAAKKKAERAEAAAKKRAEIDQRKAERKEAAAKKKAEAELADQNIKAMAQAELNKFKEEMIADINRIAILKTERNDQSLAEIEKWKLEQTRSLDGEWERNNLKLIEGRIKKQVSAKKNSAS